MIINEYTIKIGNKEYTKSNKIIMVNRNLKNNEYVCKNCGSEDISHCYSKHYSIDLPYCGNCGMYVADSSHKYCGFCGIKFEEEK